MDGCAEAAPAARATGRRPLAVLLAALLVGSAAAAAAAAATAAARRGPGPTAAGARPRAVRLYEDAVAQAVPGFALDAQTSCANWEDILFSRTQQPSPLACRQRCLDSDGCAAFNYKPESCGMGPDQECMLMQSGCVKTIDSCWIFYDRNQSTHINHLPRGGVEAVTMMDDTPEASAKPASVPARSLVGSAPLSALNQAPSPLPAPLPVPTTGQASATALAPLHSMPEKAPAPPPTPLQSAVGAISPQPAPLRSATAPAPVQKLPPTLPTAFHARDGNETTRSQKLVSTATLECVPYPPEEGSQGSDQKRCVNGNGLGDGHVYFWNADRGTPHAACGQHADCNCCRKKVSAVASAKSWKKAHEGFGCSNWQSIHAFEPVILSSADKCGEYCRVHQGCVGFDYQKGVDSMCSQNSGAGRGACFLWFGECRENSNACYDRYEMMTSANTKVASRSLDDQWKDQWRRSEKKGCSNWQDIQQDSFTASDSDQCAALCDMRAGCKGFGFKTANGCDPHGAHRGACVLYSGECKFMANGCWDHYWRLHLAPTTPEATGLSSSSSTSSIPLASNALLREDHTSTTPGTRRTPFSSSTSSTPLASNALLREDHTSITAGTRRTPSNLDLAPTTPEATGLSSSSSTSSTPLASNALLREDHTSTTPGTRRTPSKRPSTRPSPKPPPVEAPVSSTGHGGEDTVIPAADLSDFAADDVAEIEDVAASASTTASRGGRRAGEVAGSLLLQVSRPDDFISDSAMGAALLALVADSLGVARSRVTISMMAPTGRRLAEPSAGAQAAPGEALPPGEPERGPVLVAFVVDTAGLPSAGSVEAALAGLAAAPATGALTAILERGGQLQLAERYDARVTHIGPSQGALVEPAAKGQQAAPAGEGGCEPVAQEAGAPPGDFARDALAGTLLGVALALALACCVRSNKAGPCIDMARAFVGREAARASQAVRAGGDQSIADPEGEVPYPTSTTTCTFLAP